MDRSQSSLARSPGSRRTAGPVPMLCALAATAAWAGPGSAQPVGDCGEWRAEFVAVEGQVEKRSSATADWTPAALGDFACGGDAVRVGPFAGATLRLPDKTVFRIDQNSHLELPGADRDEATWVDLVRGIIHIISRNPRELSFRTPYLNAGLEGTEFVLAVDDDADVTVIEGVVSVESGNERIEVFPGERGSAGPGRAPTADDVEDPFDATRWTPYSARILLDRGTRADGEAGDANALIDRAGARIRRGAFAAAADDLDAAAAIDDRLPGIFALRAMIALSRGDKARAAELVASVAGVDPDYVPGLLASSYVAQARFDYASAYAAAERAANLAPENAVTAARLAELALSNGRYREAEIFARRAVALEPDYAAGHAVLGFALLADAMFDVAIESFGAAARLEPRSPLPHIGWALADLRRGASVAGRDRLELAVILDPANAALRSLMAKTYADEDRLELADTQLELASTLDPADPTALLYRAITESRASRPVAALRAYDAAAALNANEPTFQTELRIDPDAGVRDFGFGQLYRDLGFRDRALLSGWRATGDNPLEHSAHRLLSDAYALLPRHELARVNEHYQARLLQPLSQMPIAPQLGEPNIYLADDLGPRELAATEFVGLVRENGLHLQASAVGAGLDTRGYDVAMTGLRDTLSYGLGHFDFSTEGFRENNDMQLAVSSAHVQYEPSPETNLIAELRHSSSEQGDLQLLFDPARFDAGLRQTEEIDSLRVGLRRTLAAGTLLVSATAADATGRTTTSVGFVADGDSDARTLELQHQLPAGRWHVTSGIYRLLQKDDVQYTPRLPGLPPGNEADELSAYSYAMIGITDRLRATVGLSVDRIDDDFASIRETNPKLGLRFDITDRTTLRAALADTTHGTMFSRRSIQPRLEPTHVAGFNQVFTGGPGEQARRRGGAVDHRISDNLLVGIEISERDVEFRTLVFDTARMAIYPDWSNRDERSRHAFLEWLPNDRLSLSAAYRRDRFVIEGDARPESFVRLDTRRLPLEVNYFTNGRWHAGARLTLVRQSGLFTVEGFGGMPVVTPDADEFAVLDLSLGYRLPMGRGQVSLGIDNALDERFRFQDIDPENPNVVTERVIALRFTIAQ